MKKILEENNAMTLWQLSEEKRKEYNLIDKKQNNFYREWSNVGEFVVAFKEETFNNGLDRYISITKENLMYDLFNRIYRAIGKIVDVSLLHVGMSNFGPTLEGYIHGENGKACIRTIDAGGYNIQRYHFRVLIKVMDKDGNKIKKSDWNEGEK